LDDVERAISDGVSTVKALTKDARFVVGGGAAEIELARLIDKEGQRTAGLDQYAMKKYAAALEGTVSIYASSYVSIYLSMVLACNLRRNEISIYVCLLWYYIFSVID